MVCVCVCATYVKEPLHITGISEPWMKRAIVSSHIGARK